MKLPRLLLIVAMNSVFAVTGIAQTVPGMAAAGALFLAGKFKEASDMYSALTVSQPKFAEAHVSLIRTRLRGGDLVGAIQAARAGLTELPNSAAVTAAAGDVQFRISKF